MLKIINNMQPFFEDCYREISVREYAKLIRCSPPTASKFLKEYTAEGLLMQRTQYNRLLFTANRTNAEFRDLSRSYWRQRLAKLLQYVAQNLTTPTIVLFGSLAKAEARGNSDVDIALFAPVKKPIEITELKRELGREISLHWFRSLAEIPNPHLRNNILDGYALMGTMRWD